MGRLLTVHEYPEPPEPDLVNFLPQTSYHDRLRFAMATLANEPRSLFIGQGVARHGGTSMSSTFQDVPEEKLLEFPVAEDLQMGFATGLALAGYLPVCVFPRWNFLLCAANQLVNHLDRLPLYSDGGYRPKVIIRVAVPSTSPFNPGPQHDDDFTEVFRGMLRTVIVRRLLKADDVIDGYKAAMENQSSVIMVEYTDLYKNERGKA